jgi:hypothetical protein
MQEHLKLPEKTSTVRNSKGMTIIHSTMMPAGDVISEVTAVDHVTGKNVLIVLDDTCLIRLHWQRTRLRWERRGRTMKQKHEEANRG